MSVRETSAEAYNTIKNNGLLSSMRLLVYETLYRHGPCTANELFQQLTLKDRNQANIGTRLGELRELGVVKEVKEVQCRVTGMTVIQWDVTSKLPGTLAKRKSKKEKVSEIAGELNSWATLQNLTNDAIMKFSELINKLRSV